MDTLFKLYSQHLLLYPKKYAPDSELVVNWEITDTKEAFEQNAKRQPANWYYHTHSNTYRYNTNKYRCPEWSDIVWADSWLLFGCSCVEGAGLDESDTLSTRISELLNAPVMNLGISGSGPDATLFNSIRLIEKGIRPKGVIILNGDFNLPRLTLFTPKVAMPMGAWVFSWSESLKEKLYPNLYASWVKHPGHAEAHSYMSLKSAVAVWKAENIPTFYFHMYSDLQIPVDQARDLTHPGRETTKIWANQITKKLQSQS